jgi:hypothetical protein
MHTDKEGILPVGRPLQRVSRAVAKDDRLLIWGPLLPPALTPD